MAPIVMLELNKTLKSCIFRRNYRVEFMREEGREGKIDGP